MARWFYPGSFGEPDSVEGALGKNIVGLGYNARFWYPKIGGISQLPLTLSNQLRNINTDCEVTGINLSAREIEINFKHREKFDYIIYTLPLPELKRLSRTLPRQIASWCSKLKWNSIFNINLGIEKKINLKKHWVYFLQKELPFFRVGFPHNFSDSLTPQGKSSLYLEISYSKHKLINKEDIIHSITGKLKALDLIYSNDDICLMDTNDINYGYPIYDNNYSLARKNILNFLRRNNIITCGRYGSWRYMSMEGAVLSGKEAAEVVSKNI
ncbi:MAG: FAD-dependent oxidoreductase [Candidatus Omnitrophica bacterium]|nr:FAD-dependent oxidoreductase [Candidatus Omnitrophota bacterium]